MKLTQSDKSKIENLLASAGLHLYGDDHVVEDSKLKIGVGGGKSSGSKAILVLMRAGLNVFTDNNIDTKDAWSDGSAKATVARVTIKLDAPTIVWGPEKDIVVL